MRSGPLLRPLSSAEQVYPGTVRILMLRRVLCDLRIARLELRLCILNAVCRPERGSQL